MRRLLFLGLLLAATPGLANGRYPSAAQLARDPADPQHFVVQTTYGFLQSTDGGQTWHWICEVSVGYDGQEDPFIGILANSSILAATSQGLSLSADHGCGWAKIAAPEYLGRLPAIDLIVDPQDPKHAIVLDVSEDQQHHQLMATHDNGMTWTQLGDALPNNAEGLTLEFAPSRLTRLYVSARVGANQDQHAILRSDDGGLTWVTLPFNPTMLDQNGVPLAADQTQVLGTYIGAVDPALPDTVWLRVRRSFNPDQLWRSQDGGVTWQQAFQSPKGKLFGFALSPDGKQVAVGATNPQPGMWRANTADLKFTQLNDMSTYCLKWLDTGLYVCADEILDGMTIGLSTDNGDHFTAVHHRDELTQLTCSDTSRTAVLCTKLWPLVAYQLGAGDTTGTPPPAAKGACQLARGGSLGGLAAAVVALIVLLRVRQSKRSARVATRADGSLSSPLEHGGTGE